MLGIAVLFFLALWVIITIVAMVIGSKFGRNPATKLLGAFLGFMLTMGGLIAHWTIEYIQIQRTVTHLCETEGGIKVYVTPEEWREQIGEEEWDKLYPYKTDAEKQSLDFLSDRTIDGVKYYFSFAMNERLAIFDSAYHDVAETKYTGKKYDVAIDIKNNQVIVKLTTFSTGVGQWMTGGGYNSWINNIKSCSYLEATLGKEFTETLLKYSNQQLN